MMAGKGGDMLRLSLRDGERVIVNGAVLRARGRTEFMVENGAAVLRGRDVMTPEQAITPARALYLSLMLAYVDGHGQAGHRDDVVTRVRDLSAALEGADARAALMGIVEAAARDAWYPALVQCRALIAYEDGALARA